MFKIAVVVVSFLLWGSVLVAGILYEIERKK